MRIFLISGLLCLNILLASCGHSDKVTLIFEGDSMEPTISNGDRIIVDEAYYDEHEIQRGDIVLSEIEPDKLHVKRILGLPGERVQMGNGQMLIDGEPVSEEWLFQEITYDGLDIRLGDKAYFLLGDGLDMSRDSRHIGPIMKEKILGKVTTVQSK